MEWYIWIALGVLCMILEIFTPGFFFFALGLGAIITGIFGFASIYVQLCIFAITTTITFLCMKKFAYLLLKKDNVDSNIYAFIGKSGIVTKEILPSQKGYVKVESEEWSAVSMDSTETIPEGSIVEIIKLEGNKVFVAQNNKEDSC